MLQLRNALGFEELELELGRVTLLIGDDSSGIFEVGRTVIAMNLASQISDPYLAFLRLFGTKPYNVLGGDSLISFYDSKMKITRDEMVFKRGDPKWSHVAFMPAERVGIVKLLLNILESKSPTSLITIENIIEHMFAPVRFFLNSVIPPFEIAFTQEECFSILLDKLEKLRELVGEHRTIMNSEIDRRLIEKVISDMGAGDLLYIEDPGVFKPVKKAKKNTQEIIRKTLGKGGDVIIVTYRSAPLYAINGLLEQGELSPEDVRAYHFRSSDGKRMAKELFVEEDVGILPEDMEFMVEVTP